jgi:protein-tyrosine-phosphatase
MKWVTRARPKVDRVACPWLIRRFVDREAEFAYVAPEEVAAVAAHEGAIPFDVPGAELGHHGAECSFDAIIGKYDLRDPALLRLAVIVRGADTAAKDLAPESRGLEAIAEGFRLVYADDHELLERELPVYDALYAYCRREVATAASVPTIVFVCAHGAAKSVLAAADCQRLAARQGLTVNTRAAGIDPAPEIAPRVVAALRAGGLDFEGHRPRRVTREELQGAWRVVSFGCDLGNLAPPKAPVERWDEVPAVSEDIDAARAAIAARLPGLLAAVASSDPPGRS